MSRKEMDRRTFCRSGLCGAALASMGIGEPGRVSSAFATSQRPNVLLIVTDQQSRMAMSAAGNPYLNTPHMDSIANGGVSFARSYCTTPVCGPSRSSWMTGLHPHQTGVNYNGDSIREGIPTMGFIFRQAGYDTGWSGKWHLPESYPAIPKPWKEKDELGSIPGFEMLPIRGDSKKMYPFGDFADDPVANSAIEFMKRKRDKPFLLGVSLHNPHDVCYQVMDRIPEYHPSFREKEPKEYTGYPPLPTNFARDPKEPEFIRLCRKREKYGPENTYTVDWDRARWRVYLYEYYRMTERVDAIIGRILEALRDSGQEENTLILFTTDHGEGMAAHEWVVKLMLYEEPISVPFALQWKGHIPQRPLDRSHLVSGMDVLPTLCDYAGVELPKPVEGRSLRPIIEEPQGAWRDSIVTELASDKYNHDMLGRMIRTERFKYLVFSKGENPEMFFDLQEDPGETRNLVSSISFKREIREHRRELQDWIERTGDYFTFPDCIG